MNRYFDLTEDEKIKVIVGFVIVGTMFVVGIVFSQFILDRSQIDRLWESRMTFFDVAKTVLPTVYLLFSLPASFSVAVTIAYFRRRFSAFAIGPLMLLGMSAFFLSAYLLLSFFNFFLFDLSVEMQAPFVLLAFFVPAIFLILVMRTRKVNDFIKKTFRKTFE